MAQEAIGNPKVDEQEELRRRARAAAENAYAPYSQFRVGAALRLANGAVVTGANVENASYGLTICAERSALVRAVAEYGPGVRITAMAIENLNGAVSAPCGACRQVLAEFAGPGTTVTFSGGSGAVTMAELLPYAFTPRDLQGSSQ